MTGQQGKRKDAAREGKGRAAGFWARRLNGRAGDGDHHLYVRKNDVRT